ncbi:gamma-glutamylcyclotransferase family protein [Nocardia sp. NPDC057030]|uniref:gamma-glutamylcyclotransferase family protein n=1 Tax=unclassified Nocardia TaxID=2637762 RepID=UPI003628476C
MKPPTRRWEQCAAQGYSLFVYGTLQFPEVLEVLIDRVPRRRAATASGWRVAALPGLLYPGLVPQLNARARGLVLSGLTAAEWEILDAFEDDQYDLRAISLAAAADRVSTYVWTAAVAQDDWCPEHFTATHLPDFVTQCAEWRRGF